MYQHDKKLGDMKPYADNQMTLEDVDRDVYPCRKDDTVTKFVDLGRKSDEISWI